MAIPQQRGRRAEALACRFLQGRGLRLLARNYRSRRGEIDLIMQDGDELVFVEVRYRHNTAFGTAAETVTAKKQQRIIHCARYYLHRYQSAPLVVRFDVVSIERHNGQVSIDWVRDAFRA